MATRPRAWQRALVVFCALTLASHPAWAQHGAAPSQSVQLDRDDRSPPHLLFAGYTTPCDGSESAAHGAHSSDRPRFGGTIYFAVFHNTAAAGNAFGVRDGFDASFLPGKNGPPLDVGAAFLYVYQVVNDRAFHERQSSGTPTHGFVPAAAASEPAADVAGFALALLCEPRQITSWGHFPAEFTIRIPGADQRLDARVALSAHPAIAEALPAKEYRPWPAKRLLDVTRLAFGVGPDVAGLDTSHQRLARRSARLTAQEEYLKQDGVPASLVDVTLDQRMLDGLPGVGGRRAVFRALWNEALVNGRHSLVFGYTSNLPPTDTVGVLTERAAPLWAPALPGSVKTPVLVASSSCGVPIMLGRCGSAFIAPALPAVRIAPSSGLPTPADRSGFAGGAIGKAPRWGNTSLAGPGLGLFPSLPGGFGGSPGGGSPGGGPPRSGAPGDPKSPPPGGPDGPFPRDEGNPPPHDDPPGDDPPGDDPPGSPPDTPVVAPAPAGILLAVLGIPGIWFLCRRRQARSGV